MNSSDRLKAIVVIWGIFGLVVGITCNVGGTQVEEVVLAVFLGLLVLGATLRLSGVDLSGEKAKREADTTRLLDMVSDEELDILRQRLSEQEHISTLSPPFDR
jgi:hypothetical protein